MPTPRTLTAVTAHREAVTITTTGDPTGAAPSFALVPSEAAPTTFVDGTWAGSWSSTTGKIDALTPVIGDGEALDITAGTDYELYARWTVGVETPTVHAGRIRAD